MSVVRLTNPDTDRVRRSSVSVVRRLPVILGGKLQF